MHRLAMNTAQRALLAAMWLLVGVFSTSALARQIDTATYLLLERGMTEGEILVRAGPPDFDSSIGETRSALTTVDEGGVFVAEREAISFVKEFHYIPEPGAHDPYLTVITFRGGRVIDLRREKVFSRAKLPGAAVERVSDDTLKIERVDKTLQAAEDYAAIRDRYMQEAAEPKTDTLPSADSYFRIEQPDGTVYYGDRLPD